ETRESSFFLFRGNRNRERFGAGDGVFGGELPFAERGVGQRVEAAGAAIGLEDAEHRRRERREGLPLDDRAVAGAEQLHVERVAAPAAVEGADDLVHAARLRRARLALFDLTEASAVGYEQRQRAAD